MTDKEKFITQLDDKISEVSNQDAVRAETMKRELDDGTMGQTMDNVISIATYMYTQGLSAGFSDNQSFYMACKMAGMELSEPYSN